jgi:hypothetical protein
MPTPLNETGSYEGLPLGLGTTAAHLLAAPKIKNKNTVVMVSIGASVQNQISERFEARVPELTNPKFKFVNLCQPSQDINNWLTSADVWATVTSRLNTAGVLNSEVQVVWLQGDILNDLTATFPSSPLEVKAGLLSLINKLKVNFPKLKQVFLSARPYSGFTEDVKHDEPKGYFNGWACKWLVTDQINGLISATPWICDSIYMWTDGENARTDGFSITQANYNGDGIHLSSSGKTKFGNYLFDQLKAHSVSSKYFY